MSQPQLTPTGKRPKGAVAVHNSNNRIQLVFRYGGKRHYLSLGLPWSEENIRAAEVKARQIESDIAWNNFDLVKYKFDRAFTTTSTPKYNIYDLWLSWLGFKETHLRESTIHKKYRAWTNHVKKLPTHNLEDAVAIQSYLLTQYSTNVAKQLLQCLAECCKWSIKQGKITTNPFVGMAASIKLHKSQRGEEWDIHPFSIEERDLIIEAIATDRFKTRASGYKHSSYVKFIEFLFLTGCRPSEAVALQWKHIASDYKSLTFEQVVTVNKKGERVLRKGLKTQDKRKLPINRKLEELLRSIQTADSSPSDLVFPSPKNTWINVNNVRNRVWYPVLEGLGLEKRSLYQCRHSFCTTCLENGLDAKDVAKLVGNTPEVVYRNYAGNMRHLYIPEF